MCVHISPYVDTYDLPAQCALYTQFLREFHVAAAGRLRAISTSRVTKLASDKRAVGVSRSSMDQGSRSEHFRTHQAISSALQTRTSRLSWARSQATTLWTRTLGGCPPDKRFWFLTGIDYLTGYNVDYDWKVIAEAGD